jgi:L-rhamnose mutarotase
MAHRAYIGQIRPGKVKKYIKAHEEVWPKLIDVMRKCGIKRESCFVFGNHIFVYVEADDIDATMEKLNREPLNRKWDVYMEPLLEKPGKDSHEFFPPMQEVFRM